MKTKRIISKTINIIQIVLLFLIAFVLIMWSYFSTIFPWFGIRQIIGITIALSTTVILYFNEKLNRIISENVPCISNLTLAESLNEIQKRYTFSKKIRIYSFSSWVIVPILKELNINTNEIVIFLHSKNKIDKYPKTDDFVFASSLNILDEWKLIKKSGKAKEVDIYTYHNMPTEYFITVDDKMLIHGNYFFDKTSQGNFGYLNPYVIFKSSDENLNGIIENYIFSFDMMINDPNNEKILL